MFSITEKFLPEAETIRIGDTIWISSNVPKKLVDVQTQQNFYFENANNLGSVLIVSDITKFDSSDRGAVNDFSILSQKGKFYTLNRLDSSEAIQIEYVNEANQYSFQGGLVALKAGLYIFLFDDAPNVYRNNRPKCGVSSFEILNANTNQHLHLFEDYLGEQLSENDAQHSYCVKVSN